MKTFFNYYLKAKTKYSVHSPFVYEFMTEVLEDDRYFYAFDDMLAFYVLLKKEKKIIDWNGEAVEVKSIFKSLRIAPPVGELLFRLANYYQYQNIVSLGNGLAAMWLAQAVRHSKVLLIEQNTAWANILTNHQNFENEIQNFEVVPKWTDKINNSVKMPRVDVLIFDAKLSNIDIQTTFEEFLPYLDSDSLVILTNKNADNSKIWKILKQHHRITLTIDLFQIGFLYLRTAQRETEHFQLIDHSWKPWASGFWG